jgi:uncharacterized protein (DUF58 family)
LFKKKVNWFIPSGSSETRVVSRESKDGNSMKLSKEVLQKVRNIEIHTRRLLSGTQLGDYSSARKGSGLEFDQLREYQPGDDIRFIDWNSSARQDKVMVREYIEERNRTIMLVVDGSASQFYGSSSQLKQDLVAQVASVLAIIADSCKDFVGLILFEDEVKTVLPAKHGRKHVHAVMEQLFIHQGTKKTSITKALERLIAMKRKDMVVFLLSDFIDTGYEKLLKIVCKKYDTVAIRCLDKCEKSFPSVGYVQMVDSETGEQALVHATNLPGILQTRLKTNNDLLKRCGAELLELETEQPFVGQLVRFFRQRMLY